ncbi:Signal recognition particle receptor subunit alpha, partial [Aduncisulcus paluster]
LVLFKKTFVEGEYRDLPFHFEQRYKKQRITDGNNVYQWIIHNTLSLVFLIAYDKSLPIEQRVFENFLKNLVNHFIESHEEDVKSITNNHDVSKLDKIQSSLEKYLSSMSKPTKSKFRSDKLHARDSGSTTASPSSVSTTDIRERLAARKKVKKITGQKTAPKAWEQKKSSKKESPKPTEEELLDHSADKRRPKEEEEVSTVGSSPASLFSPVVEEEKESGPSVWGKIFSTFTGGREMTAAELEEVLSKLRTNLVSKNVASKVSDDICRSVKRSLVKTKKPTLSSVRGIAQKALEQAVKRVLMSDHTPDVISEVRAAATAMKRGDRSEPYKIVFVGVNGVGKSTTLAKVSFFLKERGVSPLIAACDTFRSAAVEQLRKHSRALGVDVYARGYGKDPAEVASSAIRAAKSAGKECVLIDTAGRMQGNQQLMVELAKLVTAVKPELVLFVGDALCGNDSIDQLTSFEKTLGEFFPKEAMDERERLGLCGSNGRKVINGIVLTKFDTIGDKPGTALSLVYQTNVPIVFVGVGQRHGDLTQLDVKRVTASLVL